MNSFELTMAITAVANTIACNLSDDDLNLVAAAFTQLGDTMTTIAAQRARCKIVNEKEDSSDNQKDDV